MGHFDQFDLFDPFRWNDEMIIKNENTRILLYKVKVELHVSSAEKAIVKLMKIREQLVENFNVWDFKMGGDDSDKPDVEDILSKLHEIVDNKQSTLPTKKTGWRKKTLIKQIW